MFLAAAAIAQPTEAPSRYIMAGRTVGLPAFSPEGLMFVLGEDQRLHYLDAEGNLQARLGLERRWALGPVHGSGAWVAVVTNDRRLHRIDYTRPRENRPGTLALLWSVTLPAEAVAGPALLTGGRLALLLADGQVRCWEPDGALAWTRSLGTPASSAFLASDVDGTLWVTTSSELIALDPQGRIRERHRLPEPARALAVDREGRPWVIGQGGRAWQLRSGLVSLPQAGVTNFYQGEGPEVILVGSRLVLRQGPQGAPERILLPHPSSGPGALSRSGALHLPLERGGFAIQEGNYLARVVESPLLEGLALSPNGVLVGLGRDWSLYFWAVEPPPREGWYQANGSPDGGLRVRRVLDPATQRQRWEGYNGFRLARLLLERGDRSDVERVVQNLEEAQRAGRLDTIPYAPGLLLEVCQIGIERVRFENLQLVNDWPDLRLRAARLLEEGLQWDMRDSLLRLIRLEHSEGVLLQYLELLGRLGPDPDGSAAETVESALKRNPSFRLGEAALGYLQRIRQGGDWLAHPAQRLLLQRLITGPYPRFLRERAWDLLRRSSP